MALHCNKHNYDDGDDITDDDDDDEGVLNMRMTKSRLLCHVLLQRTQQHNDCKVQTTFGIKNRMRGINQRNGANDEDEQEDDDGGDDNEKLIKKKSGCLPAGSFGKKLFAQPT